jgi:multicomponent K+:H+ antiporter subunit C
VILGLAMLSYAVNVFLFASGRLALDLPPMLSERPATYTDPLPQALVLTAIVISFGMTALVVMLALGPTSRRQRHDDEHRRDRRGTSRARRARDEPLDRRPDHPAGAARAADRAGAAPRPAVQRVFSARSAGALALLA